MTDREWTQDEIDSEMIDDKVCPACGGSGVSDECECQSIEDICCCLHPRPMTCDECGGEG